MSKAIDPHAWDLGYPEFCQDCRTIIGQWLWTYGWVEKGSAPNEYLVAFERYNWRIEIDLLTYFPHIYVTMVIHPVGVWPGPESQLDRALGLSSKVVDATYDHWKAIFPSTLSRASRLKAELYLCRAYLENCYLPILRGEFSTDDFEAWLRNPETGLSYSGYYDSPMR